jgi:hypothetical protein
MKRTNKFNTYVPYPHQRLPDGVGGSQLEHVS